MIQLNKRRLLCHFSAILLIVFYFIFGSGCTKTYESYQTHLSVPLDLQRVEILISESDEGKLEFTSEENISFFTQYDGIDLESVPYSEVVEYQNEVAGLCTYQVDLYGNESYISYEFSLPYIKLADDDWCKVVDEQIEYELSTSLLSLPADNPSGVTIWEVIFTF